MGTYSVGDAINQLMEKSHWKPKIHAVRLRDEWETIVGKTIAKYTRNVQLFDKKLTISTDVAPLKQELQLGRDQLKQTINDYFKERVVDEIIIK